MGQLAVKLLAQYAGGRITPVSSSSAGTRGARPRPPHRRRLPCARLACAGVGAGPGRARSRRARRCPPHPQDAATAMLSEWLADPACNRNSTVRLVAGLVFAQEGNEVEALKALNGGGDLTLEM